MHVQQYDFPSYGFSEPKNSLSYIYIYTRGIAHFELKWYIGYATMQQNNKDIPAMNI